MGLTAQDKLYIKELVSPLASKTDVTQLNDQLIAKISALEQLLSQQEGKIDRQDERIAELENALTIQGKRITDLESINSMQRGSLDKLKISTDNIEQYSRRDSLRLHGKEVPKGKESNDDVMLIVKECIEAVGLPFNQSEIVRAHRVGKATQPVNGKSYQSIIIKFKHFDAKQRLYRARPRGKRDERPPTKKFSLAIDLTKRKLDLLKDAREASAENPNVDYCFSDVNAHLGIRSKKGKLFFYNTISEFREVIAKINE